MTFTVADFQDLIRLLDERPEWRVELRRHVLSDELLQLPDLVRGLSEVQRHTDEQLGKLTAQIEALTARVETLTGQVETLTTQVSFLVGRVGAIDGELMELRFARRAHAYLARVGRRLRILDPSRLSDLLQDAVDAGQLTEHQRETVLLADLVARGQRQADGADAYFVVEVSAGVGIGDVRRVIERSQLLERLGDPVVPVVAGHWVNFEAERYARSSGVEQVLMPRKPQPPEPEPEGP